MIDILHQAMVVETSYFSDLWAQFTDPSLELLHFYCLICVLGHLSWQQTAYVLLSTLSPLKDDSCTIIFSHDSICVLLTTSVTECTSQPVQQSASQQIAHI